MNVPDGTEVRLVVDDDVVARHAAERLLEDEGLDEAEVMDDLHWATGSRFS